MALDLQTAAAVSSSPQLCLPIRTLKPEEEILMPCESIYEITVKAAGHVVRATRSEFRAPRSSFLYAFFLAGRGQYSFSHGGGCQRGWQGGFVLRENGDKQIGFDARGAT